MKRDDSVCTLIQLIRRGDEAAAEMLVRQYEQELRREIRLRLRGAELRRILDSMDICQSVLASFFVRTALGHYRLETSLDVMKLLMKMARNKVVSQYRRQYAERRHAGRTQSLHAACVDPHDRQLPPAEAVALSDLLEAARSRLDTRERQLAELRRRGLDWQQIAARVGGTANGQSRKLSRAVARISEELQLNE